MCDDGTGNHEMVENGRRRMLEGALSTLEDEFEVLRTVFDDAERAMGAGAWTGRPATRFGDSLSGRVGRLGRMASNARSLLTDEIASEPEEVPKCSLDPWDTMWPYGMSYGTGG